MLTFYISNSRGNAGNAYYPVKADVNTLDDFKKVISYDHVCAEYVGNHRKKDKFRFSNVCPMDCDNTHSDNPADWYTREKLLEIFKDINVLISYSRNHMKPKQGKAERPRLHVYFPIHGMSDGRRYAKLKEELQKQYPFFDKEALGESRFMYYTDSDDAVWHNGGKNIDQVIDFEDVDIDIIPEGSRNTRMHKIACNILVRYGDSPETYQRFREEASQCEPPLPDSELGTIWRSAARFYNAKVKNTPGYIPPEKYGEDGCIDYGEWLEPVPFGEFDKARFPVEALPGVISRYVLEVAESTQTPVDMAAGISIAIMSVCLQGKYNVRAKEDWTEPLNTYVLAIAPPSERKSSVLKLLLGPVTKYEYEYNRRNAGRVEANRIEKNTLARRQKALEDRYAKGKATREEVEMIAQEIADFREIKPLQLYVDDVTTEKLASVMAENDSKMAIISSEGGIFDMLSGVYTKTVNIDAILKAYSGDSIKVDRIGRKSECILDPKLTILLMAQPKVVSSVMSNKSFRGRGLTARFLYSMPDTAIGHRNINSQHVNAESRIAYEALMDDLLRDESVNETIRLSEEAWELLREFSNELEPEILGRYAELSDWVGKLIGNTLRIAGLLCRAGRMRPIEFLTVHEPLVIDESTMEKAISIGRYFLNHAMCCYGILPDDTLYVKGKKLIRYLQSNHVEKFDKRLILQMCTAVFKNSDELQPVLDFLEDYSYITFISTPYSGRGRPPKGKYVVNPRIL